MNNFQLLLEMGKVYVVGLVVEKSVRAFGCNNKADLIKGFTFVCCGCLVLFMFTNSIDSIKTFFKGLIYYINPVHYFKALWMFFKDLPIK